MKSHRQRQSILGLKLPPPPLPHCGGMPALWLYTRTVVVCRIPHCSGIPGTCYGVGCLGATWRLFAPRIATLASRSTLSPPSRVFLRHSVYDVWLHPFDFSFGHQPFDLSFSFYSSFFASVPAPKFSPNSKFKGLHLTGGVFASYTRCGLV